MGLSRLNQNNCILLPFIKLVYFRCFLALRSHVSTLRNSSASSCSWCQDHVVYLNHTRLTLCRIFVTILSIIPCFHLAFFACFPPSYKPFKVLLSLCPSASNSSSEHFPRTSSPGSITLSAPILWASLIVWPKSSPQTLKLLLLPCRGMVALPVCEPERRTRHLVRNKWSTICKQNNKQMSI